ncbi:MAG: LysR family transcriptional regulator [Vicinamibacterales bacterium]
MDLELRHLRLVSAVAECGSLTRAGAVLHLTQSALSHQLLDIEDRLGARLFHRLGRRMIPTPAGDRLLASARSVLAELCATEDAIRAGLQPASVPLRITTECYTVYHWLPPVLKNLRERYPNVELRIDVEATKNPLTALLSGGLDLAIMSTPVRNRHLVSHELFEDELMLLVAASHPLASQPAVRLSDFRDLTMFTYSPREESSFINETLRQAGVSPATVQPVQITEALIELVRAGLGVAVLARRAVQPHVEAARGLRAIPITARGVYRQWCAVVPRRLANAEHVNELIRLVIAHAPAERTRPALPFRRHTPAAG